MSKSLVVKIKLGQLNLHVKLSQKNESVNISTVLFFIESFTPEKTKNNLDISEHSCCTLTQRKRVVPSSTGLAEQLGCAY